MTDTLTIERSSVAPDQAISSDHAHPVGELVVERHTLAAMKSFVAPWRSLAERVAEPNVFYAPDFALAAAPLFGDGVIVVVIWADSARREMLGMIPLRVSGWRTGRLVPVLINWTHAYAPLGVPLIDPACGDQVVQKIIESLADDPHLPNHLLLSLVPDEGMFSAALTRTLTQRRHLHTKLESHQRALLAPADVTSTYLEDSLGKKRSRELRRQRRRLEEDHPVTLRTSTELHDVALALSDFLALEASGWKGRARTAAALDPDIRTFFEKTVAALAEHDGIRIDRLMVGDRAIAAGITLRSGDAAWFWKIAYDEGRSRASPGVQLTLDLTQSLIADPAIARIDSCAAADHPMIDHIWRERLTLSDRLVSLNGSLSFALARKSETLRRRAYLAARQAKAMARHYLSRN